MKTLILLITVCAVASFAQGPKVDLGWTKDKFKEENWMAAAIDHFENDSTIMFNLHKAWGTDGELWVSFNKKNKVKFWSFKVAQTNPGADGLIDSVKNYSFGLIPSKADNKESLWFKASETSVYVVSYEKPYWSVSCTPFKFDKKK